MFGHRDVCQAMGRWKKTHQTSGNLEQLNIFREFGLNPHTSLIFHKPVNRNWKTSYQCLTPNYSPRIRYSHKGRTWGYAPPQNPSITPPSLEQHQQRGQWLLWPGWHVHYNPRFTYAINCSLEVHLTLIKILIIFHWWNHHCLEIFPKVIYLSRDISLYLWYKTWFGFVWLVLVWGSFLARGRG